jgi:ABC-type spermidine/putrescine transport system permease subunit I
MKSTLLKLSILIYLLPSSVLAACTSSQIDTIFGCVDKGTQNTTGGMANGAYQAPLTNFLKLAFIWTSGTIATLSVMGFIFAGYKYITSQGNPDKIKEAKDIILSSITAIIVMIFSWALFNILGLL